MSLHMIKLCVGISSVDELVSYRKQHSYTRDGFDGPVHIHRTRMRPRRSAEIVMGGSLYWVIRGAIQCRQNIVALEPATDSEGRSCCDIIMAPDIVRTVPFPRRPFQGWRYLPEKDAPADLAPDGEGEADARIAAELAELGLI